jgi:hypothetical protein
MDAMARTLMIVGAVIFILGAVLYLGPAIPFLGRLPGDIRIERPGFRLYFPFTSCLLVSAVLSLILWIVSRLR